MSDQTRTIGLVVLSIAMIAFSYLFYLGGETFIPLVLLFVGVVLALSLASTFNKATKKKR